MKKFLTLIAFVMVAMSNNLWSAVGIDQKLVDTCRSFEKPNLIKIYQGKPIFGKAVAYCNFRRKITAYEAQLLILACDEMNKEVEFMPFLQGFIQVQCKERK